MESFKSLARTLVDGAIDGGGITIDLEGNDSVRSAYLVGGAVPTRVISSLGVSRKELVQDVVEWLERVADKLPGHVLGSWQSGSMIYLDVVTVIRGEYHDTEISDLATHLGEIRGELSIGYIYDNGEFTEV